MVTTINMGPDTYIVLNMSRKSRNINFAGGNLSAKRKLRIKIQKENDKVLFFLIKDGQMVLLGGSITDENAIAALPATQLKQENQNLLAKNSSGTTYTIPHAVIITPKHPPEFMTQHFRYKTSKA